ncbi:hypothetical protein EJ110_NYTH10345 [Nymphaea thermarum]|nr:hypothetical protein EJ110_NYTH10345 [Nymphaea thermarum]
MQENENYRERVGHGSPCDRDSDRDTAAWHVDLKSRPSHRVERSFYFIRWPEDSRVAKMAAWRSSAMDKACFLWTHLQGKNQVDFGCRAICGFEIISLWRFMTTIFKGGVVCLGVSMYSSYHGGGVGCAAFCEFLVRSSTGHGCASLPNHRQDTVLKGKGCTNADLPARRVPPSLDRKPPLEQQLSSLAQIQGEGQSRRWRIDQVHDLLMMGGFQ